MTTFYRLDGQALTYREYWRLSPNPLAFLPAALGKLLHIPVGFHFSIPRIDKLDLLEPNEVPVQVEERWQPALQACQELGFRVRFYYTIPVLERHREGYAATLLSDDGEVAVNVCYARDGLLKALAFSCVSRLQDGRFFITTDQPKKLEPRPTDDIVRLPGAPPERIVSRHREGLGPPDRIPVRLDDAGLRKQILEREQGHVDFHISRGVYIPMAPDEIEAACARLEAVAGEPEG